MIKIKKKKLKKNVDDCRKGECVECKERRGGGGGEEFEVNRDVKELEHVFRLLLRTLHIA